MAITPRTMRDMVPAPASTAGIVNTPVPTMLPITSPVAEVTPRACAFSSLRWLSGRGAGAGATGVAGTEDMMSPFGRPRRAGDSGACSLLCTLM